MSKRNRRNRKDIVYGGAMYSSSGRHGGRQGSLRPMQHRQGLPTPSNINEFTDFPFGEHERRRRQPPPEEPSWSRQHIPDRAHHDFVPEIAPRHHGADNGRDRGGYMVHHHPHLRGYNGPIHQSASGYPVAAPGYFAHPRNAPQAHGSMRRRDEVEPSLRQYARANYDRDEHGRREWSPSMAQRTNLGAVAGAAARAPREGWLDWGRRKLGEAVARGGGGSKKKKKKYKPSKKTRRRTRRRTRRCTRRRRY